MNNNNIYQVKGQNDHSSYHIAYCSGNLADIKSLELNNWAPKKINDKIIISHKTRNFPMPWVDMIVKNFVA